MLIVISSLLFACSDVASQLLYLHAISQGQATQRANTIYISLTRLGNETMIVDFCNIVNHHRYIYIYIHIYK